MVDLPLGERAVDAVSAAEIRQSVLFFSVSEFYAGKPADVGGSGALARSLIV
ncbi:hypothetical protein [Prosthecochloris sp. SCSIO W1103]|uniref:hypothetical protein n=1 Tax=Prosthecochloris sp. SCSIO W1103 TaxID=2992244 RepID=UPI00223D0CB6|nr:hypothetical protein [Prosthecochloris sp. SCSIO W1103]UZJ36703.1 hypothetical protein OO005_08025 [Prosthecochloris sp. SCSIO W1103]